VLTFHSQQIAGSEYANNDHVALDESLRLIRALRLPILPLLLVVSRIRQNRFSELPRNFVCITFDDGPDWDWKYLEHPTHGKQAPMAAILRRHSPHIGPFYLRKICATSFVIASPKARKDIAVGLHPDHLSDSWWRPAQASGFLYIGTHGWNHVHPSVSDMRATPELIERFDKISAASDAELQIERAARYIRSVAGNDSARLFAYPYGQVSEYIATVHLPNQTEVWAAFTTDGAPLVESSDIWRLPRYVCGWHWKSGGELTTLLTQ
jgi:peptidoglycan/xylan/chitin deacetylase (PgdA/CDA1 family)